MREKTKESHFVPKFYLKNFLDKNAVLHKYDIKKNNYYSFDNLKKECSENNLYLIKNKISNFEICFFMDIFGEKTLIDFDFCFRLSKMLNGETGELINMIVEKDKVAEKITNQWIKATINIDEFSRKQETIYTYIENEFQPIYNNILMNNILPPELCQNITQENISIYLYEKLLHFIHQDFFEDLAYNLCMPKEYKIDLLSKVKLPLFDTLHYILSQYFRTQKLLRNINCIINSDSTKSLIKKVYGNNVHYNSENINYLYTLIMPINLAKNLLLNNFHIVLLNNKTDVSFIISDNPCFNLYSELNKKHYEKEELEIYFPLCSNKAFILTNNTIYKDINDLEIDNIAEVDRYNKLLIKNTDRYVYGNSENLLKRYFIGDINV